MSVGVKSQYAERSGVRSRGILPGAVKSKPARKRTDTIELGLFWAFVAGLAWVPYWYGSNDLVAWGINAVLFPGLALVYEVSLLARGEPHPVGIREIAVPAALFSAVVLWIAVQNATWTPTSLAHPIWAMATDALGIPVEASISVNRDLTVLALLRLVTAASVFWIALQLCRNAGRASSFIKAIAIIACAYAAYGIIAMAVSGGPIRWFGTTASRDYVTSTFVNRNHYATYAGIGLVAICGLVLRHYRREVVTRGGSLSFRVASIIDATGQKGAFLLGGAFLSLVALLLTGSRGGVIATGLGLLVLGTLTFRPSRKGSGEFRASIIVGGILVAVAFLAFGDIFMGKVAEAGISDQTRLSLYAITLRSILDSPVLGYGYGTFMDVFPMFRDRSIAPQGYFEEAHNTYLEVFQGLGLLFGAMLVASVGLMVLRCFKGAAMERQQGVTLRRIAASAAVLVGVHALVDFSLQMQAVTLTFMALLGGGVAQPLDAEANVTD
jgi:O-antigen ligase